MADDLTLLVGGASFSGWTSVLVARGIERCPSNFQIELTERYPGEADGVLVNAGDSCVVALGDDVVVSGYVDRVTYTIDAGHHVLIVIGRGKCADLVDCSAIWPSMQMSSPDAYDVATKLAQPFGVSVSAPSGRGLRLEQFNITPGESVWDVIERCCRWGALLAYEQADGSLILTQAGQEQAASGFTQGVNVQYATIAYTTDTRFQTYVCWNQGMEALKEIGDGLDLAARASDPGITRIRPKIVINETPSGGFDFAQRRINWEANRRIGRSMQLHLTTDSWRDSAGTLWTPNTLAPLSLPILKCGTEQKKNLWLISEVTYRRDSSGTTCDLTLMPPEAFTPEPAIQISSFIELGQLPQ